jgi:transcription antitermination protein NusB
MENVTSKPIVGTARAAARLAAVQALYQIESTGERPALVMTEFRQHRIGKAIDDDHYVIADDKLFIAIVDGVTNDLESIDTSVSEHLTDGWSIERLDLIVKQILRAGVFELTSRADIPPKVVISEYVEVAKAFFERPEAAFVNGHLDSLARSLGRT